jgi:polysaccharide deacetylase 2 family uncharacterized protein YibQ
MAFLPPNERQPYSATITKDLKQYMIHLPLEASTRKYEEKITLYVDDSLEKIDTFITKLKKLYPKAKYLNNHTGSKFTSSKKAMYKLLKILKKHDLIFVDSRTSPNSVTKQLVKNYDLPYIARDIFSDNKPNKTYIKNQLLKAISIAKKTGKAVAIGHARDLTLEVLRESKNILQEVELVYIDQI